MPLDLSQCAFADSSVINALVVAHTEATEREGRLEVLIPPGGSATRRLIERASLGEIMPIHSIRNGLGPDGGGDAA